MSHLILQHNARTYVWHQSSLPLADANFERESRVESTLAHHYAKLRVGGNGGTRWHDVFLSFLPSVFEFAHHSIGTYTIIITGQVGLFKSQPPSLPSPLSPFDSPRPSCSCVRVRWDAAPLRPKAALLPKNCQGGRKTYGSSRQTAM